MIHRQPPALPDTGRPLTLAPRGLVVAPHALASTTGVAALRAGGSAVDAAIATSAVLNVVYPHMSSVGGDAFWLIYDAARREVRCLNAAGRAPASSSCGQTVNLSNSASSPRWMSSGVRSCWIASTSS